MRKILLLTFSYLVVFGTLRASSDPKITIKIGIYYTAAAGPLAIADAEKRVAVVQEVLDAIEADTYQAALTSFTRIDYKEPGNRLNDYALDKYDGIRQVFVELLDHVTAYTYFNDLGQSGSLGMLQSGEVDENYVLMDLLVRSDINIFIVEEDGLSDYYFVENPLDPADDDMGDYVGTQYEGLLPAVIHTAEYQNNEKSIALAVFGLLADPDNATPIDEESESGSLLSFFSYYYDPDNFTYTLNKSLSADNECVFRQSLKKMKLESLDIVEINRDIKGSHKSVKIDANDYARMVSTSTKSYVLAPTGADDYVSVSADAYTADFTQTVTCVVTGARSAGSPVKGDGEVEVSTIIPDQVAPSLTVYPNPFSNQFTIRFAGEGVPVAQLYIYDMRGRKVASQSYDIAPVITTQEIQFDASELNAGMYVFRLKVGKQVKSGTIIKEYKR